MRINKFLAQATELSRRGADAAVEAGRVIVDGKPAEKGTDVTEGSIVMLDGRTVERNSVKTTIMLNKPVGYVCSRNGQGSETIYDLLPAEYRRLNPVGRLDKDSSGLLLLTNDGDLANELTHPKYQKTKVYEVVLDKPLQPLHHQMICDRGIMLEDGISRFLITEIDSPAQQGREREASGRVRDDSERSIAGSRREVSISSIIEKDVSNAYEVQMTEGRNRQIRRTFAALSYNVVTLHRTRFGSYDLAGLKTGQTRALPNQ